MRTITRSKHLLALALTGALALTACSDDDGNNSANNQTTNNQTTNNQTTNNQTTNNMTTPDAGTDMGGDMGGGGLPEGFFIDGMDGPASVSLDPQGVLHIDCQTNNDCFRVQGYFHAKHRFFQMDVRRRFARGRITALVGALDPALVDLDVAQKLIFSTRDGQPIAEAALAQVDEDTREMLEAYSEGVNSWIRDYDQERNEAALAPPFAFLQNLAPNARPEEWTPADSIATGFALLQDLSDSSSSDLRHGRAYAELDPVVANDILAPRSLTNSSTYGASGETYAPGNLFRPFPGSNLQPKVDHLKKAQNALAMADARLDNISRWRTIFLGEDHDGAKGSNNWVVAPERTSTGNAYMANDPHLALSNPALWYMVEMDSQTNGSGDLHTFGVTFAGFPGQLLGHNENIGWGGTVVFYDLADAYVETLTADGTGVVIDGNDVPFETRTVEVEIANGDNRTVDLLFVPQHGPVLSVDEEAGTAITFKWAGQEAFSDLNMFYDMMRAGSLAEAKTALEQSTSTNQNWVVVDSNKEIGWFPYSAVPNRPWASQQLAPWLPLPGDGSAEWDGSIPLADLPQLENPSNGFIATANQDATGARFDGDPTNDGYVYLQGHTAIGARHQRIVDVIEDLGNNHDADTMAALQGDDYMLLAELALPELLTTLSGQTLSTDAQAVVDVLTDWDYTCPSGYIDGGATLSTDAEVIETAAACHAFHAFFYSFSDGVFGDELEATPFSGNSSEALRSSVHILRDSSIFANGEQYYDDVSTAGTTETKEEIVLAAIEKAAAYLVDIGPDVADWVWGDVHQLTMRADLLDSFGIAMFNNGPFPAPGGQYTVNVANVRNGVGGEDGMDRNFGFSNGPSMRLIVEATDNGLVSKMTLPGGQVQFPDSDYYDNLIAGWIDVTHFDVLYDRAAVEAAAVETFTFEATPSE